MGLFNKSRPMYCSRCEERVRTYTRTREDTSHPGLYYKFRTTYCRQCDADLDHETIASRRR